MPAKTAMRLHLTLMILAFGAVAPEAQSAIDATLVRAASEGRTGLVRELLQQGADANEATGDHMTGLHWAAERGDAAIAELLLFAGASVNVGTRIGGYTPLHVASANGNSNVVQLLLEAKADSQVVTTNSGVMPLHLAAASGDIATVQLLLKAGADVNAREGSWGQTPLIFAAETGREDMVRALLQAGADPAMTSDVASAVDREKADKLADDAMKATLADFKQKEGGRASWQPSPAQVQAAVEVSREIQRRWPNISNLTCDESDELELPAPVVEADDPRDATPDAGCDAGDGNNRSPQRHSYGQLVGAWGGLTPLLHAVRQGHRQTVLALLEGGADIDQPSAGDNTTPLLMAAVNGQFDLALLLLEQGADPNRLSDAGTGPLFAVLERQWVSWANYAHPVEQRRQSSTYRDVLTALLEAGADPNQRLEKHLWYAEFTISVLGGQAGLHYQGASPFWRAAQALDVWSMRQLIAHGAESNLPTVKVPERRRRRQSANNNETEDPTGLPPVPVGGPHIFPLHVAAGAGYGQSFAANAHRHVPDNWLPAVKFLVEECGADVNLRDANGYTAMHHAASRGDNEMIRYLVEQGGDVTLVSRSGQTTADMANGPIQRVPPYLETIELLVSLGAVNNNKCLSC